MIKSLQSSICGLFVFGAKTTKFFKNAHNSKVSFVASFGLKKKTLFKSFKLLKNNIMLDKSFGLIFFLKTAKNSKKSEKYIYARVTVDGDSREISTKRVFEVHK